MLRTLLLASIALNIAFIVALPLVRGRDVVERVVTVRERTEPEPTAVKRPETRSIVAAARSVPRDEARSAPRIERQQRVDAPLIQDVLCDYAKRQAAEQFKKDEQNIRDFVTGEESDNARDQMEKNWTEQFQDALGLDADDAELRELVERSAQRELEFWRTVRDEAKKEPPDWGAATDAAVSFYRDVDDIIRTVSGEDAMTKVRIAQLEARSQILAIGASLADRSWEEIAW